MRFICWSPNPFRGRFSRSANCESVSPLRLVAATRNGTLPAPLPLCGFQRAGARRPLIVGVERRLRLLNAHPGSQSETKPPATARTCVRTLARGSFSV